MSHYVEVTDSSGWVIRGNAFRTPIEAEEAYKLTCLEVDEERQGHSKLWRRLHGPKGVYLWDTSVSNRYPIARHFAEVVE